MLPLPSFDQVSVISDLHIGGEEGFQIFDQGQLLAAFIDDLRSNAPIKSALVINGDIVDFLAEPSAKPFDPVGATGKLDRIFKDKHFTPVWDAIRKYIKTRRLAITLGNHDIELALPWVKDYLLGLLTDGDAAAQSRVTLAFDGSGFACTVGRSNLLCVHGNEVDTWNVTDYERLRRIASDVSQGRTVSDWTPNAGSKLVIEVMNDLKRSHAFVDLLKPEKEGAVRLLLVLKPDQRAKLRSVADVAGRRIWDGVRRTIGWLSADDPEDPDRMTDNLARIVGNVETRIDTEKLLDRAESSFRNNTNPVDLVYGQQGQQLGLWDALTALMTRSEPHEIARQAIKDIADTPVFDIDRVDDDFKRIDELVGPEYDIVVAGHTHLARALSRTRGSGRYFNSGTWACLMRLTDAQLGSETAFKPVFATLQKARTIAELGKLVGRRPTVVTVTRQGERTRASLDEVSMKGKKIISKSLAALP